MATAIDIGSEASDRTNSWGTTVVTVINKNTPATGTGKITTVEIWAATEMAGCEVATFFVVSGNNLSTRDYETVNNGNGAGVVLAGSKQTFVVDLDVVEGDYLGIYYSSGALDCVLSGAGGWYVTPNADHIPCTNQAFTAIASRDYSLGGTGTTEEAGTSIMFTFSSF